MSSNAPAATRAMGALRVLAQAPGPVTATALGVALGLPRSSTYHLLAAMEREGFVVHFPEEQRWGLGVTAFEIGAAYLRHEPLERLARPVLLRLVAQAGNSTPLAAHLGVLHGRETLYLLKESTKRPITIVAEVGVRLPASLTASGRAMLAQLPTAQVRALFPNRSAFVDRTGIGPMSLPELRRLLQEERNLGYSQERGMVTSGFSSVAVAVRDHNRRPVASIGLTFPDDGASAAQRSRLAATALRAAIELSRRIGMKEGSG